MKKLFFLLATALLLLTSCGGSTSGSQPQAIKCRTITVSKSNQTLLSRYAASLQGCQIVEIRPQVSGRITQICIREGDAVRKGQTLFVIDQVPYKAALEVAKSNVASAQTHVDATRLTTESKRMLREREVISEYDLRLAESELAGAEASLEQARAQLTNAENNLSYTEVKSPVDGCAGMIPYHVGALVSSSVAEPLVTVSDVSVTCAYFSMNENRFLDLLTQYGSADEFLANAPEVDLLLSNGKPYDTKGHIRAVSGLVDAATGAVSLRADFANPNRILMGGGSATVVIPTPLEGCLTIPQTATYEIQEKKFVFRIVDGIARSTEVKVFRLNDGHDYVVESGLSVGDVIVAEGAGLLKDGTHIIAE